MPFLSHLDDRAKPKGSRDPLGFELVWTRFGRRVVGNLTTVTSSMDNFAVALLGFYWAEQLTAGQDESRRHELARETFLRYEQLTGYLRYLAGAGDILGITRVKQRIEQKEPLRLGLDTSQLILSDQASYGLWGLYSTAASETSLAQGQNRHLTPLGRQLTELIIANLGTHANELFGMLTQTGVLDRRRLEALAKPFLLAIRERKLQERLLHCLMAGPKDHALQNRFWSEVRALLDDPSADAPNSGPTLLMRIEKTTAHSGLKQALIDIRHVDRMLVAANDIFTYCRRKDGASVDELVNWLSENRDYSFLPQTLPEDANLPRGEFLHDIHRLLCTGKLLEALLRVLELNKEVMRQRGGAPWVELENSRTLRVRVKAENARIPDQQTLTNRWDYDYFFGSFLNIALQHRTAVNG